MSKYKNAGKLLRAAVSWTLAVLLAFLSANAIVFFYDRPAAMVDTPNGASKAIRRPGAILIHGTEGFGITKIDENGYTNSKGFSENGYVLMMGSSHSQGKEIASQNKYSELVSREMETDAYNIGSDGHYLPSMIQHFHSAVVRFPNAECIIMEIPGTDYSAKELERAMKQPTNIDMRSAAEIFPSDSISIKNLIKEWFPLLSLLKSQRMVSQKNKSGSTAVPIDETEYGTAISKALQLIRSEYDGPMAFVYHPATRIEPDGSMSLVRSKTIDLFSDACAENNIAFIDVGNRFLDCYAAAYQVPYGFANTTMGSGHLNETGHRIMADAILDYLREGNVK